MIRKVLHSNRFSHFLVQLFTDISLNVQRVTTVTLPSQWESCWCWLFRVNCGQMTVVEAITPRVSKTNNDPGQTLLHKTISKLVVYCKQKTGLTFTQGRHHLKPAVCFIVPVDLGQVPFAFLCFFSGQRSWGFCEHLGWAFQGNSPKGCENYVFYLGYYLHTDIT